MADFIAEEQRKSAAQTAAMSMSGAGEGRQSRREAIEEEAVAVVEREDPCAAFVTFQYQESRARCLADYGRHGGGINGALSRCVSPYHTRWNVIPLRLTIYTTHATEVPHITFAPHSPHHINPPIPPYHVLFLSSDHSPQHINSPDPPIPYGPTRCLPAKWFWPERLLFKVRLWPAWKCHL